MLINTKDLHDILRSIEILILEDKGLAVLARWVGHDRPIEWKLTKNGIDLVPWTPSTNPTIYRYELELGATSSAIRSMALDYDGRLTINNRWTLHNVTEVSRINIGDTVTIWPLEGSKGDCDYEAQITKEGTVTWSGFAETALPQ